MKKIATLILVAMLLPACSTLTNQNAPLVHVAVQYATIKAVKLAHDPAQAAKGAREVLAAVESLMGSASLDAIDAKVKDLIAKKAKNPEDALLFDAIRQAAYNDLSSRLSNGPAVAMNNADRAALSSVISDIRNGLTLAGY